MTPGYTLGALGVSVFFSLSGYLVYQSILRDSDVWRFLARRALRIFPGLVVMLLFTVLLLGPLVTILSAKDYFSRHETWEYLWKIKLWGDDRLPGVFNENHYPHSVNSSLWTLKWEWVMYCLLALLALVNNSRWNLILAFAVAAIIPMALATDDRALGLPLPFIGHLASSQNPFPLGAFFFIGAVLSSTRVFKKLYMSKAPIFLIGATGVFFGSFSQIFCEIALFAVIPLLVVSIGESTISQRIGLEVRHDISYGLYIYAFPVQQAIINFIPEIAWWGLVMTSIPTTTFLAFISWTFVESPALRFKKYISKI